MATKKPDHVVFNEETERYDASIKPYGTNVSAPAIKITDTIAWRNRNVHKVNRQIEAKHTELQLAYQALLEVYEWNNLIYQSKFSFEPIAGETYHLYRDKKQQAFLSVIAPHECSFDFVGSFYLDSDSMWKRKDTLSKTPTIPQ